MDECVTPVLFQLGDLVITDCAGTWPASWPVLVVGAGATCVVFLMRAFFRWRLSVERR